MALEHLDKDREFLTRGGVFTNDVIDAYMGLKMQEVTRFRMSTHPWRWRCITAAKQVMTAPEFPPTLVMSGQCRGRPGGVRGKGRG